MCEAFSGTLTSRRSAVRARQRPLMSPGKRFFQSSDLSSIQGIHPRIIGVRAGSLGFVVVRLETARRHRGDPRVLHEAGGSGRDDEFPGCASGFHRGVRLDDLIEAVDAVDRYDDIAGGDGIQEFL
jgi:hypothetical protein